MDLAEERKIMNFLEMVSLARMWQMEFQQSKASLEELSKCQKASISDPVASLSMYHHSRSSCDHLTVGTVPDMLTHCVHMHEFMHAVCVYMYVCTWMRTHVHTHGCPDGTASQAMRCCACVLSLSLSLSSPPPLSSVYVCISMHACIHRHTETFCHHATEQQQCLAD